MNQAIAAQVVEKTAKRISQEEKRKLFDEAFIRYKRRKEFREYQALMKETYDEQSYFDGTFDT